jgi:DNA-binding CsgD family transcriptional regulator
MEQNGVTPIVRNPGLYEFDEKRAVIAVYAGEARLNKNDKQLGANAGFGVWTRRFREFRTSPDPGGTLFSWSRSRSQQLSRRRRILRWDERGRPRPFQTTGRLAVAISRRAVPAGSGSRLGVEDAYDLLTSREREILQLVAERKLNKEIATTLNLSPYTVETHRRNLQEKLNLHSLAELILYAVRYYIS